MRPTRHWPLNSMVTISIVSFSNYGGHQLNSCKRKKLLSIDWLVKVRLGFPVRRKREREEGVSQREPQPLRERVRGGESYMKGNAIRIIARTMADWRHCGCILMCQSELLSASNLGHRTGIEDGVEDFMIQLDRYKYVVIRLFLI